MNAVEWGWKNCDGALYPIMTDLPPAPKQLLKIVKCSCKRRCDSTNCTCKHNGLSCTIVCKIYKGSDCSKVNKEDCDQVLDYDGE